MALDSIAVRRSSSRRALPHCCILLSTLLFGALSCGSAADPAIPEVALSRGAARIPARLRRLSNAEFANTASALLGERVELGDRLPPDVRQEGYTQNAAQSLPSALGTRVASLALELAEAAVARRFEQLLPCKATDAECVERTVADLTRRAYRRDVTSSEREALLDLYEAGSEVGGARGGITWVLAALLQSPSLWYLREGARPDAPAGSVVALRGEELASSLAYTVSGAPPDPELLALGQAGELQYAATRAQQARRLLGNSETRHHFRRFVLEWLEVDQLTHTAKDPELHPEYDAIKPHMLAETSAFVDEVMVHHGGSFRTLLDGGFTSVDPEMARYYGFAAYGPRVSLEGRGRRGVLQHASFLSAHAHEDSSSPVKRGDFILRKVLCRETKRPRELDIEVVIPPPDPAHTTRERFSQHGEDPNCAFCHDRIDGLGFAFENFDAAGRSRELDNAKPVDNYGRVRLNDRTLAFDDSVELSRLLARDPLSSECMALHAFRFLSAQSDPEVEASFQSLLRTLPRERRESLVEVVVAFVSSDLFLERRIASE